MKKRLTALALACAMLASLCACGDKPTTDSQADVTTTTADDTVTTTDSVSTTTATESKGNDEYDLVEELAFGTIFVNARSDRFRQQDVSILYSGENQYFAGVVYDMPPSFGGEYSGELNGTIDHLLVRFLRDVSSDIPGNVEDKPLENATIESMTINGFDGLRFKGTVFNDVRDYNVYGYSFLINETPVMAVGLVFSDDQEQELIDMMVEEVDTIASSVRTER